MRLLIGVNSSMMSKCSVSIITYIDCTTGIFLEYLPSYIDNITSIDRFPEYELVLVIVRSVNNVKENITLDPVLEKYDNIKRVYVDSVSSQYDAWNIAINNSTGDYITNSNLDDRRSKSGLSMLHETVSDLHDVCYGHVTVTTNKKDITTQGHNHVRRRWECFEINSTDDLFYHNSPHCFPLWSRRCHDNGNMFNTYKFNRCGDYEFWLRGSSKLGFKFHMADIQMGCYYHSPEGLSTDADGSREIQLENRIMRLRYGSSDTPIPYYHQKLIKDTSITRV